MKNKRIIYLDMDGVLANFFGALGRVVKPTDEPMEIYEKGFYRNMPVNEGAIEAVKALIANPKLDVYIASKPCSNSPYCASEKYEWVKEHFPALYKKIFLTSNKNMLSGHTLVDDHPDKWNDFNGEIIYFNPHEPAKSWANVIRILNG